MTIYTNGKTNQMMYVSQIPATLNQPLPNQNEWYTLASITNGIIYEASVNVEDANETIEAKYTIDGVVWGVGSIAATHSTKYYCRFQADGVNRIARIDISLTWLSTRASEFQGKTVLIEVRKTTANGAGNLTGCVVHGKLMNTS